jgi:hypothetical protein
MILLYSLGNKRREFIFYFKKLCAYALFHHRDERSGIPLSQRLQKLAAQLLQNESLALALT